MKQGAVLLALALLPALGCAKCVELTYMSEGRVISESSRPAAGALVGVSWIEHGQAAGPAVAVADGEGRYRLSVRFRPGDDIPFLGPSCTQRLDSINVTAYAGDLRSSPTRVQVTGHNQQLPEIVIGEPAASSWSRPG
jgi:hypothetical protein